MGNMKTIGLTLIILSVIGYLIFTYIIDLLVGQDANAIADFYQRWGGYMSSIHGLFIFGGVVGLICTVKCKKQISDKAGACPKCGVPVKDRSVGIKRSTVSFVVGAIMLILIPIMLLVWVYQQIYPNMPQADNAIPLSTLVLSSLMIGILAFCCFICGFIWLRKND